MDNIKVSVILPVYNGEKYIKKCMESLISQTLKEIEIICVDDGSVDGTLEALKEYENLDNVTVITQENAGAGAARNKGMSYAKGEYLSFLDADDIFEKDMLEVAYNKAVEASNKELNDKDQKGAIMKWREVLGNDFPEYTGE